MTFSFTHGDYEETRLPIGEDAIIIATYEKLSAPGGFSSTADISNSLGQNTWISDRDSLFWQAK